MVTRRLRKGLVVEVSFVCRHNTDDSGIFEGFWTGEVDTWGKYTFRRVDGGPTLYLFPDEILEVAAVA